MCPAAGWLDALLPVRMEAVLECEQAEREAAGPAERERAVSLYLRPSRFLKIRLSLHGVRVGIGPRWLRLYG